MYHPVDLAGYSAAYVTYAYWMDVENFFDWLEFVYSPDGSTWWSVATYTGSSGGWALDNVTIPTTAQYIGFVFYTDGSGTFEGAYVDDVLVVGNAPDLSCTASVSATSGTEAVTSFDFTGGASGGVPPFAWSWDFGGGGSGIAQSPSHTYPVGGAFAPSLTVTDDVGQTCMASAGSVTVAHLGPLTITVVSAESSMDEGGSASLTATVRDSLGHDLTSIASILWTLAPLACGIMTPSGASANFDADEDSGGGTCTIAASANAAGLSGSGTASVEVVHAGPITVELTPATGAVDEGGALALTVVVRDAGGHDITGSATVVWSVSPEGCGTLSGPNGSSTTFTSAGGRGGTSCTVTASATFGTNEGDDAAVVTVRAGVLAGVLPLLVLLIIAVIVVTVLLMVLRRRRGKPAPAFDQRQPIAPIATRSEDPPLTER
jgi:hypothetical protein